MNVNCQISQCSMKADFSCQCNNNLRLCGFHFVIHCKKQGSHSEIILCEILKLKQEFYENTSKKIEWIQQNILIETQSLILEIISSSKLELEEIHSIQLNLRAFTTGDQLNINEKIQEFENKLLKFTERYKIINQPPQNIKKDHKSTGIELCQSIKCNRYTVRALHFWNSKKYLISGNSNGVISIWKLKQGKVVFSLTGHEKGVLSLDLSNGEQYLVSGSEDNTIKLWDLNLQHELMTFEGHLDFVRSVLILPNNKFILSASSDSSIKLWRIETGEQEFTLLQSYGINSIDLSIDQDLMISGSDDKLVKVWNFSQKKIIFQLRGHSDCVTTVGFFNNNQFVYSGGNDFLIIIWNLTTRTEEFRLAGHSGNIFSVKILKNSKYLMSASSDKSVKIWSIEKRKEKIKLTQHTSSVYSLTLSNEGNYFASGSADETIKIWKFNSY